MKNKFMLENLTEHYTSLGFKTAEDYVDWCSANGFSTSPRKPLRALNAERHHVHTCIAMRYLKESNKPQSLRKYIEEFRKRPSWTGEKDQSERNNLSNVTRAIYDVVVPGISSGKCPRKQRDLFFDMLLYLDRKSKLTKNPKFIFGLWQATEWHASWVRTYDTWVPKSHNEDRQFSHFIRHILAKYEVPVFMDSAWTWPLVTGNSLYQAWFVHIGSGKNIRTVENLPIPLTKKSAHYFLEAPPSCSINEAFRWGQVMAMGGNQRLMGALRGTPLMSLDKDKDEFCQSVIRFLVANPMLDMNQVGPLLDYIWNQKYTARRHFVERGRIEELPPPEPGFTLTGRTVDTLMAQMERWHRQLGKERKGGDRQWEHHKEISDFEHIEGSKESKRIWRIEELLSSAELTDEGRVMRHCVASYAGSCESGRCSIWSMTCETFEGKRRHLTIEIDKNKYINQMRGYLNRSPDAKEKAILNLWCVRSGITIRTRGWWI